MMNNQCVVLNNQEADQVNRPGQGQEASKVDAVSTVIMGSDSNTSQFQYRDALSHVQIPDAAVKLEYTSEEESCVNLSLQSDDIAEVQFKTHVEESEILTDNSSSHADQYQTVTDINAMSLPSQYTGRPQCHEELGIHVMYDHRDNVYSHFHGSPDNQGTSCDMADNANSQYSSVTEIKSAQGSNDAPVDFMHQGISTIRRLPTSTVNPSLFQLQEFPNMKSHEMEQIPDFSQHSGELSLQDVSSDLTVPQSGEYNTFLTQQPLQELESLSNPQLQVMAGHTYSSHEDKKVKLMISREVLSTSHRSSRNRDPVNASPLLVLSETQLMPETSQVEATRLNHTHSPLTGKHFLLKFNS